MKDQMMFGPTFFTGRVSLLGNPNLPEWPQVDRHISLSPSHRQPMPTKTLPPDLLTCVRLSDRTDSVNSQQAKKKEVRATVWSSERAKLPTWDAGIDRDV